MPGWQRRGAPRPGRYWLLGPPGRPADADSASSRLSRETKCPLEAAALPASASGRLSLHPGPREHALPRVQHPGGRWGRAVPREVTPLHGCQDRCWSAHVSFTVSRCWATGGAGPHTGSGHRPPGSPSWAAASSSRPVPNLRAQVTTLSPGCPLPLLGQDRDQMGWEGVGSGRTRPGQRSSFRGAAMEGGVRQAAGGAGGRQNPQ